MPAQLIHLRQRIKAIETIKKITHAMRLISFSTYMRLRHKKAQLAAYKNSLLRLSKIIKQAAGTNLEQPTPEPDMPVSEHIVILVSSQKGLCGIFNENLFKLFSQDFPTIPAHYRIITIGNYAADYIKSVYQIMPFSEYTKFDSLNFVAIAQAIADIIINNKYATVTVYSNIAHTFFTQKPQNARIYPLPEDKDTGLKPTGHTDTGLAPTVSPTESSGVTTEDYLWEQTPAELENAIHSLTLLMLLQELLFESLLAEQAARFLSMDGATRNADSLLTDTKLAYNKSRQASITRELTELSSSLSST